MKIEKEIKRVVFTINHDEGRAALYDDVLKALPSLNPESVTRIMRRMAITGELKRIVQSKYVLPKMEIAKEPRRLDEFMVDV